ncbi:MAG: hypothetical protein J6K39_04340 [Clostridia bacterium]|nr:hypothetical protein [Clostridia bacterium]
MFKNRKLKREKKTVLKSNKVVCWINGRNDRQNSRKLVIEDDVVALYYVGVDSEKAKISDAEAKRELELRSLFSRGLLPVELESGDAAFFDTRSWTISMPQEKLKKIGDIREGYALVQFEDGKWAYMNAETGKISKDRFLECEAVRRGVGRVCTVEGVDKLYDVERNKFFDDKIEDISIVGWIGQEEKVAFAKFKEENFYRIYLTLSGIALSAKLDDDFEEFLSEDPKSIVCTDVYTFPRDYQILPAVLKRKKNNVYVNAAAEGSLKRTSSKIDFTDDLSIGIDIEELLDAITREFDGKGGKGG